MAGGAVYLLCTSSGSEVLAYARPTYAAPVTSTEAAMAPAPTPRWGRAVESRAFCASATPRPRTLRRALSCDRGSAWVGNLSLIALEERLRREAKIVPETEPDV